jgi:predicted nucleotidyltransferase
MDFHLRNFQLAHLRNFQLAILGVLGMAMTLLFVDGIPDLSMPVDLIPFGGISSDDRTIAWPPGRDIQSVAGFQEALRSSVLIRIDDLEVRLASVPGLALLKNDRAGEPKIGRS